MFVTNGSFIHAQGKFAFNQGTPRDNKEELKNRGSPIYTLINHVF